MTTTDASIPTPIEGHYADVATASSWTRETLKVSALRCILKHPQTPVAPGGTATCPPHARGAGPRGLALTTRSEQSDITHLIGSNTRQGSSGWRRR